MESILSRPKNLLLTMGLFLPAFALAVWYPYVGKIGALLPAFSTMLTIYMIPIMVYLKAKWIESK